MSYEETLCCLHTDVSCFLALSVSVILKVFQIGDWERVYPWVTSQTFDNPFRRLRKDHPCFLVTKVMGDVCTEADAEVIHA